MRVFKPLVVCAAFAIASLNGNTVLAQVKSEQSKTAGTAAEASKEMTDGEVRKVDAGTGKVTIKHGEIKNLGMPPMTMVFGVKEKGMLEKIKTGDKIRFRAIDENGKLTLTDIQAGN